MPEEKKPKIKKNFQAPKGTYDILPADQIWWDKVFKVARDVSKFYGFGKIDTPVIEGAEIYVKGTGLTTDIVEKQMYTLKTKGGDLLALRPELTPGIIRAYLERGMSGWPHPVKLYSCGPLFRYERPQAGRYRQHQQINFDIIGSSEPVSDVQVIQLFFIIFQELGLKGVTLQINSIGCADCRPSYRKMLINYFKSKTDKMCADCKRRLKENPLRILDCKEEQCIEISAGAPQTIDHLCEKCHNHLKGVLEFLDELEIPYILNSFLVRGLDYYSKTVFEFWPENETGRQSALGGGGRYDYLVKTLGGRDTPAIGGGCGLERVIYHLKQKATKNPAAAPPKVFLVQLGDLAKRKGMRIFEELRKANIPVTEAFSKDSIKTQMKIADRTEAKLALILGQQEVLNKAIIIRDMSTGIQETVAQEKLVKELKKRLAKK
jgi:histidyl-tRNA synthetase